MKKLLLFMCLLVLALVSIGSAYDLNDDLVGEDKYTLISNDYKIINISGKHLIEMNGFYTRGLPGELMLPSKVWDIVLPNNCDLSTVEIRIVEKSGKFLKGEYDIPPAPLIVPGNDVINSSDYYISKVYNTDALYPNQPVKIVHKGQLREAKLIRIEFTPFQYNPVSKKLYLNERVVIEITYKLKSSILSYDVSEYTYELLKDLNLLNPEKASISPKIQSLKTQHDYVVVTTNYIKNNSQMLSKFVEFLKIRGFNPLIITEDDYGYAEGQQRAINIRNWLKNNYQALGIKYVLLIGNPDPDDPKDDSDSYGDIPMLMTYPREGTNYYPEDIESPTDYFYADLTGNWDSNGNGIYGEPWDNIDLYPEVFVGRIPVYNNDITQLDAILKKIMNYGCTYGEWRKRVMLPMAISNYENENGDTHAKRTDGRELPKYVVENILKPNGFSWFVMYETEGLNPVSTNAPYFNASINRTNVINEWNKGYGIVFWWGHGSYDAVWRKYWVKDDGDNVPEDDEFNWLAFLHIQDVSSLNDQKPAIVYQCSCYNGYPEKSNNLGYELLKKGAIATVSSSRVSWYRYGLWTPDGYSDNAEIGYEFVKRVVKGKPLGEALYMAKANLIPNSRYHEYMMNMMDFNLYGDPSLTINEKIKYTINKTLKITIRNPNDYDLKDYQVKINLSDYLELPALLKVTDINRNPLKFCYEQSNGECGLSPSRVIWVKLPFIPAKGDTIIYITQADEDYAVEGDQVFDFYDDFNGNSLDKNKWEVHGDGSLIVTNGFLQQHKAVALITQEKIDDIFNKIIDLRANFNSALHDDYEVGFGHITKNSHKFGMFWHGDREGVWITVLSWKLTNLSISNGGKEDCYDRSLPPRPKIFSGKWNVYSFKFWNNSAVVYVNNSERYSMNVCCSLHTDNLPVLLILDHYSDGGLDPYGYLDWIRIRKYADQEPIVLTMGYLIYMEPIKNFVAPNEDFEVEIYVEDGGVRSVLVNFTFENAEYLDSETYGVFGFMETIVNGTNYVKYLGLSTDPVDTSSKIKVASVKFKAVGDLGDEICFNVITALIDGINASVISKCISISSEPWQWYDQNHNGKIDDYELINAILDWLNGQITDDQIINIILKWIE